MPKVRIQTSDGPIDVGYTISTPTVTNADTIDRSLPTIILLHPVYIPQVIYHPQFSDARLRRFNMIAVDSRVHGETGGIAGPGWGRQAAAADLHSFMEALALPSCHLFGMSMGACIALQLSIDYPKHVASACLLSPLPFEEPPDVIEGRQEIANCWIEGVKSPDKPDEVAQLDAVYGACQLGFNSTTTNLINAIIACVFPATMINFGPGRIGSYYRACVEFFVNRKRHPQETLAKITSPIKLVHCEKDIAYPIEYAEEIHQAMLDAGVNVSLVQVKDAYHFGNISHPDEVDTILHDFVLEHIKSPPPLPDPSSVVSPYEEALAKCGLYYHSDSDSSD